MNNREKQETKKGGKRKMSGWIIALIVVAAIFAVGAVFCAPWSPVHKAMNAKAPAQQTEQIEK
jgi:flagellar basal body-associated protein FliL